MRTLSTAFVFIYEAHIRGNTSCQLREAWTAVPPPLASLPLTGQIFEKFRFYFSSTRIFLAGPKATTPQKSKKSRFYGPTPEKPSPRML